MIALRAGHVGGSERPSFRLAKSGQSEKFEKVSAVVRIRVERCARTSAMIALNCSKSESAGSVFPVSRSADEQPGSRHDSVTHRERENSFQAI